MVLAAGAILAGLQGSTPAAAVIEPIYTLPFQGSYERPSGGCFHCYYDPVYGWHEGTDYNLGTLGVGGEPVAAASEGTALNCGFNASAGYFVVINHGNGHRTRYLHLSSIALTDPDGVEVVARGQTVGYEGNLGFTIPPGSYNLHFETRHGAQGTATCGKSGVAVDPYAPGASMWTLDPPVYASTCNPPVDSASGPGRYPGVFRQQQGPGQTWWYQRHSNDTGGANNSFIYGQPCDMAVAGDWDGNGTDTVGVVRPYGTSLQWHLRNSNSQGSPYTVFTYGLATDFPVAGDWDGNGTDTIGIFRWTDGTPEFHLNNQNNSSQPEYIRGYGIQGDRPVVGDWDGTGGSYGTVTIGIFRPSTAQWHLSNSNVSGYNNPPYGYGLTTDTPITGDWNWDGIDTVGVFRPIAGAPPEWKLNNLPGSYPPAYEFSYGAMSDKPVTGNWN